MIRSNMDKKNVHEISSNATPQTAESWILNHTIAFTVEI